MPDKLKFLSSEKSGPPKQPRPNKVFFFAALLIIAALAFYLSAKSNLVKQITTKNTFKSKFSNILEAPSATPEVKSTPTPSPTPKPLTFSEMNSLYGPCVRLPILMYHHVQTQESAQANKQTSLTVYRDYFEKQMQYLKDKGYVTVTVNDLINFFDNGSKIPAKSLMITFDDAYSDFYTDAFPLLQKFGFSAIVFVPTGLVGNPNYLSWDQISSMKSTVLFANHTWSHKNVKTTTPNMEYEILTADTQLSEHSLNSPKTFAYPFGLDSVASINYLNSLEYKIAFTTKPGSILCKKQRLDLPRIRIGNRELSSYGF